MADRSVEIARLKGLLDSGATSITVDGVTTQLDHAFVRKRLRELIREDDAEPVRRPLASQIDLSGF